MKFVIKIAITLFVLFVIARIIYKVFFSKRPSERTESTDRKIVETEMDEIYSI